MKQFGKFARMCYNKAYHTIEKAAQGGPIPPRCLRSRGRGQSLDRRQ